MCRWFNSGLGHHYLNTLRTGDSRSSTCSECWRGGATPEALSQSYPYLEADDIRACLVYARRLVGRERVEPAIADSAA